MVAAMQARKLVYGSLFPDEKGTARTFRDTLPAACGTNAPSDSVEINFIVFESETNFWRNADGFILALNKLLDRLIS